MAAAKQPNAAGEYKCSKCLVYKPVSDFSKDRTKTTGLQSWCKYCSGLAKIGDPSKGFWARKSHITRKYGLTWQQYCDMYEAQKGLCKICSLPINLLNSGKPKAELVHIDHDHTTGRVRGLLCFNCNSGLGCFKDNPFLLQYAIDYLES